MRIAVVGTGYVGLVTGTCFAETGNSVICVDIDKEKVKKMKAGIVPIYEPHLDVLFDRNIKQERLKQLKRLHGIKIINLCQIPVVFMIQVFLDLAQKKYSISFHILNYRSQFYIHLYIKILERLVDYLTSVWLKVLNVL